MAAPGNPNLFNTLMQRNMPPSQANGIWAAPPTQPGGAPPGGMPGQPPPGAAGGPPPPGVPGAAPPPPPAPTGAPAIPTLPPVGPVPTALPSSHANVPPEAQRAANANQIQNAYANNWNPNPVLLRAMLSRH